MSQHGQVFSIFHPPIPDLTHETSERTRKVGSGCSSGLERGRQAVFLGPSRPRPGSLHVGFCCLVDTTKAVTSVPAMPIRTTLQGAYSNLHGAYSNLQGAYSNLHHSGRSSLLIRLVEDGSTGPYLGMVWADTDNPVLYIGRHRLIPIVAWADTDNPAV